jgi:hypothetical protein
VDLHLVQDGTKMSFCHGFKIKIQRNLLAMELDCSFLQVNLLELELVLKKKIKKFLFQKENGNTIALFIIFLVKSLQKEQKAQIMEYKPQSAGINLLSPQSDSTPWTLTLARILTDSFDFPKFCFQELLFFWP